MKVVPQNCPRCNAEGQKFGLRRRFTDDGKSIKLFIKCTMCNWEKQIKESTPEIEKLRGRLLKMRAKAVRQREQYGLVFPGTTNAVRRFEVELIKLENKHFRNKP